MKRLDLKRLDVNITDIAEYDLRENNLFGSSYYVYQSGEVYKKHFGKTGINENPVDDDTIFRIASMTKPITAFAVLILIDRGIISLRDKVKRFIPEFKNIHVVTEEGEDLGVVKTDVTIRHLLTHTSGFGSLKNVETTPSDRETMESFISCYARAGLDFEPFTRQAYSPRAAFDVLGAIVEKVTGRDYEAFLRNEIFIPCGMRNTTFVPKPSQWDRLISMHRKTDGKSEVCEMSENCIIGQIPCTHKLAGAGLISTLNDYAAFARMLLHKGVSESGRLISEETFYFMCTPQVPYRIMQGNARWGLGVRVITDESYGTLPVGAFGCNGVFGTHFWIDPENDICAVYMKNSMFDGGAENKSAVRFEKAVNDALIG